MRHQQQAPHLPSSRMALLVCACACGRLKSAAELVLCVSTLRNTAEQRRNTLFVTKYIYMYFFMRVRKITQKQRKTCANSFFYGGMGFQFSRMGAWDFNFLGRLEDGRFFAQFYVCPEFLRAL